MKRNTILAASLGVLAAIVIVGSTVIGAGFIRASSDKENIWMERLGDSETLNQISMPGSHNCGALLSMGGVAGKCQDAPIYEQLKMGVRFLDVRLELRNDTLWVIHGDIDQNLKYADAAKEVSRFLKEHPSEFVLLSVKEEAKAKGSSLSFEDALKQVSNESFDASFYTDFVLPSSVAEARGKAILLSRFANPTIGINCYDGWEDGGDPNATCMFTLPAGIYVQDHYKLKNCGDKIVEVTASLEASSAPSESLYLNFFSGYLAQGFPPSYAVPVAQELNKFAIDNVGKYACAGVAIFDFVSNAVCDVVIGRNFA